MHSNPKLISGSIGRVLTQTQLRTDVHRIDFGIRLHYFFLNKAIYFACGLINDIQRRANELLFIYNSHKCTQSLTE